MFFKFGVDSEGNYGYYKAGADSVTPFRSGTDFSYLISGENLAPSGYRYAVSRIFDLKNVTNCDSETTFVEYSSSATDIATVNEIGTVKSVSPSKSSAFNNNARVEFTPSNNCKGIILNHKNSTDNTVFEEVSYVGGTTYNYKPCTNLVILLYWIRPLLK